MNDTPQVRASASQDRGPGMAAEIRRLTSAVSLAVMGLGILVACARGMDLLDAVWRGGALFAAVGLSGHALAWALTISPTASLPAADDPGDGATAPRHPGLYRAGLSGETGPRSAAVEE
ncbi:MAG: hypothetical protein HY320_11985 [Armatimonadetes bacterium]|nr:hypothetical protein [Armatimonadota bacterium]